MSSQLVDINADGNHDILCGSFSGTPQIVMGGSDGFQEPGHILDADGQQVLIAKFWNDEERKWDETDRCGSKGLCTSSSAVDWDDDGDLDLILGAYRSGELFLRRNEGTAQEPKFATSNEVINLGEGQLKVPKGLAAPCIVDWNEDGLFDIMCGGSKGGVYYFENTGSATEPKFSERKELIPPVDKKGSFIGVVPSKDNMPTMPGSSWHVEPVDYDGDGDLDLLIGGRSAWKKTDVPELSDEEKEKMDKLSNEMADVRKQMNELVKDLDGEERMKVIQESKEYREVATEYAKLSGQLRPMTAKINPEDSGDFVWLFRRK